jgi:hypothetical protein
MKNGMIGLCLMVSALTATAQNSINLSGKWEFGIDRNDVGTEEKWYAKTLEDGINLPASMPEKLKGDIVNTKTQWTGTLYDSSYYFNPYMEKYRVEGNIKLPFFLTPDRHYVGVAWYKRTVNIPSSWRGERVVLYMERPHIETSVWVNGKPAGSRNSLCVAHQYDITDLVHSGKNTISVRVDNRIKEINVGPDSHSITDQTQGNWNGVVGNICLMTTPQTYFDDIQVYPDVDGRRAVVKMRVHGKGEASLRLSAESFNSDKHHSVAAVSRKVNITNGESEVEMELPMGDGMLLWDEFSPALYKLKAELTSGKKSEVREVEFGMRKFEIRGKWFYVNGRKTMLRGTVENCDFPLTGYAPMDVESWERVFRICRNYGLNHMRFHSFCPPEAAFKAADLVGFYLQPEGPSWPNHGSKLGMGLPIDDYLMDETKAMAKEYGNYASFCMLSCGNEPSGRWVDWVTKFVDYWEKTDSRRVYTGASVGNGWQWQPRSQYHVKAGARGLTWSKERPATIDDYRMQNRIDTVRQPYVSHETGQWCAFPNFNEIRKYTGVNKAKNFEIFRDLLNDNNMGEQAQQFMMASGKLQALCYKYEIEKTLRTPDYTGFQLLALNDYSGQGTALVGVLDVFFEEKGYIDASQWRRFCSPVVPLMRTEKFVYRNSEKIVADIEVANFGSGEISNGVVRYALRDEFGKLYASGIVGKRDIPVGNLNMVGSIDLDLSQITKAKRVNLEVSIDGTEAVNDWNFWVYPDEVKADLGDVYKTDTLDATALETLEKGGKVLLTAAGRVSYGREVVQQFTPVFWNTSWFKMRPPHTTGILVNPAHPLFREFPTDYHSDLQWWELVNRAQVMQFTDFPANFQPIVQSIDTWFLSRKIGMLFEANVLNGRLMMTTMDIDKDLDNRIVARQMRAAILDYMNSDAFRPETTVAPSQISDLYHKVAGKVDSYTNGSPDELKPKIQ